MNHDFKSMESHSGFNPFCMLSPLELLQFLQNQYSAINSFQTSGFCVGIVSCSIEFPPGQHSHSDYEFLIPSNNTILTKSDKNTLEAVKQKIMPFNSGQNHGPGEKTSVFDGFIDIFCNKAFIEKISDSSFNKREIRFKNESFDFTSDMKLLLSLFIEEVIGKQKGAAFMQENLANMFLMSILRKAKLDSITQTDAKDSYSDRRIKLASDFISEHYNSDFSLTELSEITGLSAYHFIRVFKKQTGKTPYDFLLDVKIERAKELLSTKDINITQICLSCGFNNPSHFSSIFKRKIGVSPTKYRQLLLGIPI